MNGRGESGTAVGTVADVSRSRAGWQTGRLWRAACWLALAGSLLALAAPWLSVRVWLGFDVFSHFMPHFAALAAGAAACLLWPRRGPWLALALVLAVPAALAALPWHYRMPADVAPAAGTLRVMSFNTWLKNRDAAAVEREIRRLRPDIVGMMEFGPAKRAVLRRLKARYPYQADCLAKPYCYLALLSRWPIVRLRSASLWEGPPYLHVTVRTPSGPLHVFVVHTLRFPWLGSQLKQLRALARIVHHVPRSEPVLVMGDFNATPFSRMIASFRRRTGLRRITWLPTWPVRPLPLPQIAIDHMFVSDAVQLRAGPFTGHAGGSDHLPVVADLALRR